MLAHSRKSLPTPVTMLVERVRAWPVASAQQARRNAMIAATACAQRRAERQDVADFLAERTHPDASGVTATTASAASTAKPTTTRSAHG